MVHLERALAKITAGIVTVSKADLELAHRHRVGTNNQLTLVHNGIPDNAPLRVASSRAKPRVAMVARFAPPKEQQLLVDALSRVSMPFELWLIGDGPMRAAVEAQVAQGGMVDQVRFLGARKDVSALLSEVDVFVLTSRWEGFPISILEAMRAGLPVVASEVGGVGEAVVHGETGMLVPRGDLSSLENALEELLQSHELRHRLGIAGRARFLQMFSADQMLQRIDNVYARVLA